MSSDLTRWIEDAEARRYHEAAQFDRSLPIREKQYFHLGKAIASLTSRLRHSVGREVPTSIGCQVLACRAHPRHGR